jgi:hypothetical protein
MPACPVPVTEPVSDSVGIASDNEMYMSIATIERVPTIDVLLQAG